MLVAASLPAGTSNAPVAFWPRAAEAEPTVKVARSWALVKPARTSARLITQVMRSSIDRILSKSEQERFGHFQPRGTREARGHPIHQTPRDPRDPRGSFLCP